MKYARWFIWFIILNVGRMLCFPTFDQTKMRKICNLLTIPITVKISGIVYGLLDIETSYEQLVHIDAQSEVTFHHMAFHGLNGRLYEWVKFLEVTIGQEIVQEPIRRGIAGVFWDEGHVKIGFRLLM